MNLINGVHKNPAHVTTIWCLEKWLSIKGIVTTTHVKHIETNVIVNMLQEYIKATCTSVLVLKTPQWYIKPFGRLKIAGELHMIWRTLAVSNFRYQCLAFFFGDWTWMRCKYLKHRLEISWIPSNRRLSLIFHSDMNKVKLAQPATHTQLYAFLTSPRIERGCYYPPRKHCYSWLVIEEMHALVPSTIYTCKTFENIQKQSRKIKWNDIGLEKKEPKKYAPNDRPLTQNKTQKLH